jgi:hypothetical protein
MGSLPKPFRRSQQEHRELTKIVNSWLRGQWCWWCWRDWKRNGHRPLPILLLVEKQYLGCFDPTADYKTKISEGKDQPFYRFILWIVCINKNRLLAMDCGMNNPIRLHHMGYFGKPSGKHTQNDGTSPFLMGKSTISMAIFKFASC